jgi:quinol monooxygenase YgiN
MLTHSAGETSMITITAIIRARSNAQDHVRRALLAVAEAVRETEPETVGYFVAQSPDDPRLFMTFERFADRAAMDRHNNSAALAEFVREAGPHLDGDIAIHVGEEISSK